MACTIISERREFLKLVEHTALFIVSVAELGYVFCLVWEIS